MAKTVLIPLAVGFEEIELVSSADILKRANLNVIIASLDENMLVSGAHGISVKADCALREVNLSELDAIALVGGYNGMLNLKADERILSLIRTLYKQNKLVAALCASPIVLNEAGIFDENTKFTCYPSCEEGLKGLYVRQAVCEYENIITSAGPATAIFFALALVKRLCGTEFYTKLEQELLLDLIKAKI